MVAVWLTPLHYSEEEVPEDRRVGVEKNHLRLPVFFSPGVAGRGAGHKVGVAEAEDETPAAPVPPKAFSLKAELEAYAPGKAAKGPLKPRYPARGPPHEGGPEHPDCPLVELVQGKAAKGRGPATGAKGHPGPGPPDGAELTGGVKAKAGAPASGL